MFTDRDSALRIPLTGIAAPVRARRKVRPTPVPWGKSDGPRDRRELPGADGRSSCSRFRTPQPGGDLEPLASPLLLHDGRRGIAWELVAANQAEGVVHCRAAHFKPPRGSRLTLLRDRQRRVQLHVQVEGPASDAWHPRGHCFRIRWVLITATERRSDLVDVLRKVLGLSGWFEADGSTDADELPPKSRLVYEAERRLVRGLGLGAPRAQKPLQWTEPVQAAQ